jgi:sec-independent protein translocase protein TatA
MLGLDNPIHIVFVLVLLLLVFGAKRLPEMGKSLGEGLRGFKDSISGEQAETHHLTAEHSPVRVDDLTSRATPEPVERIVAVEHTPAVERTPVSPAA